MRAAIMASTEGQDAGDEGKLLVADEMGPLVTYNEQSSQIKLLNAELELLQMELTQERWKFSHTTSGWRELSLDTMPNLVAASRRSC